MYPTPNNNKVSKVKNINKTKEVPTANKIKIVNLGGIDIFLKEKVGNLLISNKEIMIVK